MTEHPDREQAIRHRYINELPDRSMADEILKSLPIIAGLLAVFWLSILFVREEQPALWAYLLPALLLAAACYADFAQRFGRPLLAGIVMSYAFGLLPLLTIIFFGLEHNFMIFLAVLGVPLAAFLISERAALAMAGQSMAVLLIVLFIAKPDLTQSLLALGVMGLLLFGIAALTALATNTLRGTIEWSLDTSAKSERREALLQATQERLQQSLYERDHLNHALQEATAAALEASRLKTQFLANMSHELRTPLNAVLNFARFLNRERYGSLNERQVDLQQRILSNAEHLLGLINDVLDLAKIEAGRMDLRFEDTDLVPLLQSVMATAAGLTRGKKLEISLDCPETLPPARIDRKRIRQVLLNLLSNAAKFTDQGGIRVRAHQIDTEMIRIEVVDTGIGVAPENQTLIFEEFRQIEGDLTRQYQGTGLGLSISKRLVAMHGGMMGLESVLGQGSTFFFTVPLQQPSTGVHRSPVSKETIQSHQL